ncbi:3-hydroxyacyl-CoA dehydrogenase family protein [Sphingomonas sp. SRS2]|uniref:3-hydroxyacyl-CoA dehydrogenase family protein n=1 Tax=Sphingomonas sp. SRS2 TaxID=133190 RepID=UPI0006184B25|nr:3-hydroxyacyl-CoA dehydrogenase family protein [Sphingomonas sp. SRS2]KKC26085.1 3-hydroxyacyl-CoA dehydrogenase [Sphingomonas sp. SRS2]
MSETIGVVGAGLMGGEIALVFALAGHRVLLNDRDQDVLDRAKTRLSTLLQKGVERGFYSADDICPALERISFVTDIATFAEADMVTEAVFEAQEVKAAVLERLGQVCRHDCVIASNTSTIPISSLAALLPSERRPYFIGTHYFSPVSRMKLVEVIPGFETAETTTEAAMRLTASAGKTPIRVKDVAGFAVNRMLHMFMIEAVRLVEEGVATPEDIDTACQLGLGHPIGPFALMDAVTSSLCVQAQEIMQEAYGERFRPPPLLKQRVRAGFVGGKGRPGWRR